MLMITGAAGFIGSCFTRLMASKGTPLVLVDKLTYAGDIESVRQTMAAPTVNFFQVDIADSEFIAQLLSKYRCQAVVNFAAETHVDRSIDGPDLFAETNVLGTSRLLNTVHSYWRKLPSKSQQVFRFLQVSTDEVFGSLEGSAKFTEGSPIVPNSPYAASKAGGDHFVSAFQHTYGLPTVTVHCSNNYGPFQLPEKLIPLMIMRASEGLPLPIYGDGQQIRDWLHVEDCCLGIEAVLKRGKTGERYNIGGNNERCNLEIVKLICKLVATHLDKDASHLTKLIESVADRPGHDRRYALDCNKIEKQLGWRPQIDFESGLSNTVAWYLQNQEWVQRFRQVGLQRLGLAERKLEN